jgi:hypothetical protein
MSGRREADENRIAHGTGTFGHARGASSISCRHEPHASGVANRLRSGGCRLPGTGCSPSFRNWTPTKTREKDKDRTERAGKWSHSNWTGKSKIDAQTTRRLRDWRGKPDIVAEAHQKNHEQRKHHHDHDWWKHHCAAIILVDWGYWGWDSGWWYPAWGYDPYYSYYEYDGRI